MRTLGTANGEQGEIEVKPELMGLGPVAIRRGRSYSEDPKDAAISKPITLTIVPGPELPPRKLRAGTKLAAGLQFKSDDGQLQVIQLTNASKWLEETKVKSEEPFVLAAIFEAPTPGVYQFDVKHVGPLSLKVDGQTLYDERQKEPQWNYLPVPLQAGYHQFELRGRGGQPDGLEIRFGNSGVTDLDGKQFRHPNRGK